MGVSNQLVRQLLLRGRRSTAKKSVLKNRPHAEANSPHAEDGLHVRQDRNGETYPSTSFMQARSVKTVKIPGGVAKLHWDKTVGITIG